MPTNLLGDDFLNILIRFHVDDSRFRRPKFQISAHLIMMHYMLPKRIATWKDLLDDDTASASVTTHHVTHFWPAGSFLLVKFPACLFAAFLTCSLPSWWLLLTCLHDEGGIPTREQKKKDGHTHTLSWVSHKQTRVSLSALMKTSCISCTPRLLVSIFLIRCATSTQLLFVSGHRNVERLTSICFFIFSS